MNGYRDVELLGEGKVGIVLRVAEAETGVLCGHLPKHAQSAFLKGLAQHSDFGQQRVCRTSHAGTYDGAIGCCFAPVLGGREAIPIPATHDALDDVQALHLGKTCLQMLLPVFHLSRLTSRGVDHRRGQGHVRRVGVHLHVDDALAPFAME